MSTTRIIDDKTYNKIILKLIEANASSIDITSYRSFMFYLKDQKEFNLRCRLIDYKYLYGSLVSQAYVWINNK